ncbi:hypothetical protein E1264_42625 [Actinomadura sp. KC216]|nr:hypothetical protein E1264_42625 [Actinomadura sp. KC216]
MSPSSVGSGSGLGHDSASSRPDRTIRTIGPFPPADSRSPTVLAAGTIASPERFNVVSMPTHLPS